MVEQEAAADWFVQSVRSSASQKPQRWTTALQLLLSQPTETKGSEREVQWKLPVENFLLCSRGDCDVTCCCTGCIESFQEPNPQLLVLLAAAGCKTLPLYLAPLSLHDPCRHGRLVAGWLSEAPAYFKAAADDPMLTWTRRLQARLGSNTSKVVCLVRNPVNVTKNYIWFGNRSIMFLSLQSQASCAREICHLSGIFWFNKG